MKRVALYVRVSTQEQKTHGLSVDSQIIALQEYCVANDFTVVDIYNDAGLTASKSYQHRPALIKMMEDCRIGKIDLVLFTKLDRFFRNVPDYYACIEQMNDVPWRAIWEDYETETSAGKFKVNIMLSIAQAESERTGERIKAVNDYKRAKGWYVGKAPLGYRVENHMLVKDEATAPFVELMFNTYLTTFSTAKVAMALYNAGCNATNVNGIRKRLKSETYIGNANGSMCEPYITQEQHQLIIDSMEKHVRNTTKKYEYIFSSLVVCDECGSRMHSHSATNYNHFKYYKCNGTTNTKKHNYTFSIGEDIIERYLLENVDELISEYNVKLTTSSNNSDIEKQIKNINARIERIGIRFELGDLSVEEYKAKREKMLNEVKLLELQASPEKPIEIPDNWKDIYTPLDDVHKRMFWKNIIKEIRISKQNKYAPQIIWRA